MTTRHVLLLLVALAAALVFAAIAVAQIALPPGGGSSDTDQVATDVDAYSLSVEPWPGNLDTSDMGNIFVSPNAAGELPLGYDLICTNTGPEALQGCASSGECTGGGTCTHTNFWADKRIPLRTLSAAAKMWARNPCDQTVWLDSGDEFTNQAIGDNLSAFIDEGGWDGLDSATNFQFECPDTTFERLNLVIASYPKRSKVYINFSGQAGTGLVATPATDGSGPANPDPDWVYVADVTGSSTVIADVGNHTDIVNAMAGLKLMVTVDPGGCANALGDQRDIVSNTADTITVGSAFTGIVDSCTFTVIADNFSGDIPAGAHFGMYGENASALLVNLDIHNVNEKFAVFQSDVTPGLSVSYWGVSIREELPNGILFANSLIEHLGVASPAFFFQTQVIGANESGSVDIAGPTLWVGSKVAPSDLSAGFAVLQTQGGATALIDTDIISAFPTIGSTNRSGLVTGDPVAGGGRNDTYLMRSRIINNRTTGGSNGAVFYALSTTATGGEFVCWFSSFANNGKSLFFNVQEEGITTWNLKMTACTISGVAVNVFEISSLAGADGFDDVNLNIVDMAYDDGDGLADDWAIAESTIPDRDDNLAAARVTLLSKYPTMNCNGAPCNASLMDQYFFGASTDLNLILPERNAADNDQVRLGSCHKGTGGSHAACFQASAATSRPIFQTVPFIIRLPYWALEGGDRARTWKLNADALTGTSFNRGAP